jgi:hypothetical protein
MRVLALLALALLLAGCSSPASTGSDGAPVADRIGVVILNEPFKVAPSAPSAFQVDVQAGARNVQLEIRQDSGVLANLHVRLTGCGETDPPASSAWEAVTLCNVPNAGRQVLQVSMGDGPPAGSGQVLLRADLPSR